MLTIVAPASIRNLTTLSAVQSELNITSASDYPFLMSLISYASDYVATFCNRAFAVETVRETIFLGAPRNRLMLERWPVVSIEALSVAGVTLTPNDCEFDEHGYAYRLDQSGNRIAWSAGKIVIDYRAGYVLPGEQGRTLPFDIERAVLTIVRAEYAARGRDPNVRTEDVDGVTSTTYFSRTAAEAVAPMLMPYRLPAFG